MKKILLVLTLILLSAAGFSQDNPRPTKSRFWKSKQSTFQVKPGDILVYTASNNGEEYDFIVRVKKYGSTINFDYETPKKGSKANVNIQSAAVTDAGKYDNLFNSANHDYTNKSSLWLSKRNFEDIESEEETTMDFGDGNQTFAKGNNGILKVNYKGKEKILTVYNVETTSGNRKHLLVLTEAANPLIVMMDTGWKITLKEVR